MITRGSPNLFVSTERRAAPTHRGPSRSCRASRSTCTSARKKLVTDYIERLIRYPGALQVVDFADGKVRLVGLKALKGGLLVGQPLRELREHMPNAEARVAAIYRDGQSIEPEGDTIIERATRCSSSPRRRTSAAS